MLVDVLLEGVVRVEVLLLHRLVLSAQLPGS